MSPEEYVTAAQRTLSHKFVLPTINLPVNCGSATNINTDVLHAIIGLSTEAGEMMDVVKKNLFYGRAVDYVNLDEEVGDLLWYIAVYANARGKSFEQFMATNIAKLQKRFPEKFTEHHALNRDLAAERQVLEGGA